MTSAHSCEPIAELDGISKTYRFEDGAVLSDLSLCIMSGQTVAITGPSGSGKTTLLNIIGTLDLPDNGAIKLFGSDILTLSEIDRARLRNQEIGFVFQSHRLLPQCTVLENILLPTLAGSIPLSASEAENRARDLLEQTGIAELADRYPDTLSGGQRQRAAIARALLFHPKLLLCDEPTGALDHENATRLAELLQSIQIHQKTAIVIVTHSQELAETCQIQYSLKDGKLYSTEECTP